MYHNDWASLIFDDLDIKVEEVAAIDFHAGGPNMVEIKFAEGVDPSKYIGLSHNKNDLAFTLKQASQASTTVTFKGVPLYVPDQELLHLVRSYGGKLESESVHHVPVELNTEKGGSFHISSTTRTINASFPPTKRLRSYYWLQGPLDKDQMRRVTVEHDGQVGRQCAHCLRNSADPINPCDFNGKTSACKLNNPNGRLSLAKYFALLKHEDHYVSLKNTYMWNEEVEATTNEKFSDDFEDEDPNEAPRGRTSKSFSTPATASNWSDEMTLDDLKLQLKEKEDQLQKATTASSTASLETSLLKHVVTKNTNNIRRQIKIDIADQGFFDSHKLFLATSLANSLDINDFSENAAGEAAVIVGCDPFQDTFDAEIPDYSKGDSNQALLTRNNNLESLRAATMNVLTQRLKEKEKPERTRSRSRGRSEEEDEVEEGPAKMARHTSSPTPNQLSVPVPATGSKQQ